MKAITGDDLIKSGLPEGKAIGLALKAISTYYSGSSKTEVLELIGRVAQNPEDYITHKSLKDLAKALMEKPEKPYDIDLKEEDPSYTVYGKEIIEEGANLQMQTAMKLPVTVAGSLMPDAHQGYGLPIGGVLATTNAVIPYGVGVDIGCRMCLSIYDLPSSMLATERSKLTTILNENTLFGAGKEFKKNASHEVLDRNEFQVISTIRNLKDKASKQLGSSGSGNHFVEFGITELFEGNEAGLPPGKYLALLSHSGSRGLGATIANHYTRVAMEKCRLPKEAKHLAWLDLNSEEGQEYWLAMNLAGDYASACHHVIHDKIAAALGTSPVATVENHHNFAWKEKLNGKDVIVHRKGATPAGKGVLGIIPGSMSSPGFIVRGKGEETSLNSASHGAGRKMSRTKAISTITQSDLKKVLADNDITLIGGGLDESPQAYKDINEVMEYQKDLVDVVGVFYPKIVKMD